MKPIERTKLIFAAAALCFCCSCSSEMTDVNEGNSYQFLIASSDLAHFDSKTCIQSSVGSTGSYVPVLWMPSDELGVYTSAESNIKYTKYNQTSNEEVAAFVTSETVTGTPQVAYYPYSESAGTDPTSIPAAAGSRGQLHFDSETSPIPPGAVPSSHGDSVSCPLCIPGLRNGA